MYFKCQGWCFQGAVHLENSVSNDGDLQNLDVFK